MKEYYETPDSKGNINIIDNKNHINNYGKINKTTMNYIYLILMLILIIIIIIFLLLYFSKRKNKKFNINKNNYKNELICDNGLFLPEDDKTKCIKCSIENCNECIGSKINNICNKCNPGLYSIYENNKIISCVNCKEEGYYLINGECKEYSFKARYKPDGSEIKLINTAKSKIKEMIVDGKKVNPSNSYFFNDTEDHEIFMLLDMSKYPSSISSMFEGINRLISISFSPLFNTSNIIYMSSMFYGCTSLTSINLSNFNTSKVTDMDHMFYNCSSLKSINLSNFNISNLIDMGYMFSGCDSLTSIVINNFITSKVNEMDGMLFGCNSLTSIDLSNFITSKETNMNYIFYNCSNLRYINILRFSTTSYKIDLFDQYIPSFGTIITNKNFLNKLNINYLSAWKKIIS